MSEDPRLAAARGLRALLAEAALVTTVDVQRAVARLLGVAGEVADAAVEATRSAGMLGHGIALVGYLHAARRGMDVRGALSAFAEGTELPRGWSAYEARVAAEESDEDAVMLQRRVSPEQARLDLTRRDAPVVAAEALSLGKLPQAVIGAVAAHRAGLGVEQALVEQGWLRVVWGALGGAAIAPSHDDPVDEWLEQTLVGAAPERPTDPEVSAHLARDLWVWRAQDELLARAEDYVDPFESGIRHLGG